MYRIKSKSYVSINVLIDGLSVVIPAKPSALDLDIKTLTQELITLQAKNVISISEV